jgi:nitrate reductase NapAB chaperone NapD
MQSALERETNNLNKTYLYALRHVEVYIDDKTGELVLFDHKEKKEIERRPANPDEITAFGVD